MFGLAFKRVFKLLHMSSTGRIAPTVLNACGGAVQDPYETDEQFNQRYVNYFNRCDIDGWETRKAMNDLCGMDIVPHPRVVEAALGACRRVNDIALAIRWLEACKEKCADDVDVLYPWILMEIRPTLNEYGIPTPEQLNYHEPELWLKSVYDM